jgi:hypothetical protein
MERSFLTEHNKREDDVRALIRSLRQLLLTMAFVAGSVSSATAQVQFDVSSVFNADVIVNNGNGLDATQSPVDRGDGPQNNFAFPTQSVATALCTTGAGLPDNGSFAQDAFHPFVQLAYSNTNDGSNARRIADATGTFSFNVPTNMYSELHLFATTGNGDSDLTVTLTYTDATTSQATITVPDWFGGFASTVDRYHLVDNLDRIQPGNGPGVAFDCQNSDAFGIFGFRILPNPAKALQSVTITRTDSTGILNFFGATGVVAPAPVVPVAVPVAGPVALAILAFSLIAVELFRRV